MDAIIDVGGNIGVISSLLLYDWCIFYKPNAIEIIRFERFIKLFEVLEVEHIWMARLFEEC